MVINRATRVFWRSLFAVLLLLQFAPTGARAARPTITKQKIMNAILYDLAYHAPVIIIDLDGDTLRSSVRNLERAGILRVIGRTSADLYGPAGRLILLLTNRGQRIAASRGWGVRSGFLEIPTGWLKYMPGSYKLHGDGSLITISYRWRYEPNSNVSYLLKLGPLSSWSRSMYPTCLSASGKALNKSDMRTILLFVSPNRRFLGCTPR